ncbi:Uncharacterised protein [Mycobacteroides abscessus subsp. abscessus]|nr:Uncharacterised protein [Mycobacteroides abscessus subsp. abscessus]
MGLARCLPARMIRGRSSRSSKPRVSTGDPASRRSRAPTSRSASACATASSSEVGPCGPIPTWQWASTSPGNNQPPSKTVSASAIGSMLMTPSCTHRSIGSSDGRVRPRRCARIGLSSWGT